MNFEEAKRVIEAAGMKVAPPPMPKTTLDFGNVIVRVTSEKVTVTDMDEVELEPRQIEFLRHTLNNRAEWKEKWE